jgi:hypothetical protein
MEASMAHLLGHLPGHSRLFSAEALVAWHTLELGNIVFLKKTAPHEWDWRFYRPF